MKVCVSVALLLALTAFAAGQDCVQEDNCVAAEGCRCLSTASPIATGSTPQFVTISFNDAISEANYVNYYQRLFDGRVNPDGNPATGTFFVPHEYTDYSRVNSLYRSGQEIAVHTISKNPSSDYWRTAEEDTLVEEFEGQRTIISRFANIPASSIRGARVPNFELAGDTLFRAYARAGVEYDATITTRASDRYFPFTLDIPNQVPCQIGECPANPHPGIWAAPIIDLIGDGVECNNLQACRIAGTAEEIADWLTEQFEVQYQGDRAPINLVASAAWFLTTQDGFDGLSLFLDRLSSYNDVFLVSNSQVIDWMNNPVPINQVNTDVGDRLAGCTRLSCPVQKGEEIRYMVSCVQCPAVFPWLGNPLGLEEEEE
uniref:Putative chitin deacetylase n=1 Tax=Oryctes rhinoceros TaxID=72550 RepID=A0A5C0C9R1_ORYRH|nr:putative chitin deacetylase [Oryctes rhinoceros]